MRFKSDESLCILSAAFKIFSIFFLLYGIPNIAIPSLSEKLPTLRLFLSPSLITKPSCPWRP